MATMIDPNAICKTIRYWFPNHELRTRWQREGDVIRIYASDVTYAVLSDMVIWVARGSTPPMRLTQWGKENDEAFVGWEVQP